MANAKKFNQYKLGVTFLDFDLEVKDSLEDNTGRSIVYMESLNFIRNRFPVRILELTLTGSEINKINNARNVIKQKDGKMFDIEIICTPVISEDSQSKTQIIPVKLGKFKAELKEGDGGYNDTMIRDNKQETDFPDRNDSRSKTISMFLYREEELSFALNTNINFIYKNTDLQSMFFHALSKCSSNLKYVISDFDHNPVINRFLVPRLSFEDFLEMIDNEFGIYKTGYSYFIKDNIMYFTNKDNDPNVTVKTLSNKIYLNVRRLAGSGVFDEDANIYMYDKETLETRGNIAMSNIKYTVDNSMVFKNNPIRINPDGTMDFDKSSVSRNLDTYNKITNVKTLPLDKDIVYEYIDIDFDFPVTDVNPLTELSVIDSTYIVRKYRILQINTVFVSDSSVTNKIRGYRIIK